jgi:hypothetical protein
LLTCTITATIAACFVEQKAEQDLASPLAKIMQRLGDLQAQMMDRRRTGP